MKRNVVVVDTPHSTHQAGKRQTALLLHYYIWVMGSMLFSCQPRCMFVWCMIYLSIVIIIIKSIKTMWLNPLVCGWFMSLLLYISFNIFPFIYKHINITGKYGSIEGVWIPLTKIYGNCNFNFESQVNMQTMKEKICFTYPKFFPCYSTLIVCDCRSNSAS